MNKLKARGTSAVPPKKSISAYNIFGKEKRAEILRRSPHAKVTAVVREIAGSWAAMSKRDRVRFDTEAKAGKFLASHTCRKNKVQ